jgi:hypothetical protein
MTLIGAGEPVVEPEAPPLEALLTFSLFDSALSDRVTIGGCPPDMLDLE